MFAIAGVASGMLAKLGLPMPWQFVWPLALRAPLWGRSMAGWWPTCGCLPSWLRWPPWSHCATDSDGPPRGPGWTICLPNFQWFGLSQSTYPIMMLLVQSALAAMFAWGLRNLAAGRAVYATGSNPEAARLSGIRSGSRHVFGFHYPRVLSPGLRPCSTQSASTKSPAMRDWAGIESHRRGGGRWNGHHGR